jgi:hypothetical protein
LVHFMDGALVLYLPWTTCVVSSCVFHHFEEATHVIEDYLGGFVATHGIFPWIYLSSWLMLANFIYSLY